MRPIRMQFWLLCSDVLVSAGKFGSPWYYRCIERAADCADWSEP